MASQNPTSWPDLFVIKEFLEPVTCRKVLSELKAARAADATVYGHTRSGAVDQNVRRTLRLRPSHETIALLLHRLLDCKDAVERHFNLSLNECEEPQFLRYREGDFFVAHQDGNTGLLRLQSELRRVSTVIFLSRESDSPAPDAHCGGSLILTNLRGGPGDDKFHVVADPGTLIAFRSETTHEVTPVTHGERYSIVSWYRLNDDCI